MNTEVIYLNENGIDPFFIKKAAEVIRAGGTVVFPTETVYGLGANALSEKAVDGIFTAKGRPSDNPLIAHISHLDMLIYLIGEPLTDKARLLIERFWPGPLTLIFKKSRKVPERVTAGLDTVAVRMPDNPVALELIRASELPIAAPSANLSGKPSPTLPEHVVNDLQGRVNMILCSTKSRIGLESTVLDLSGSVPTILRPGGITYEALVEVLGEVRIDKGLLDKDRVPKSPGMKYTHYAPEAEMIIVKGETGRVQEKIQALADLKNAEGLTVGVLASDETAGFYQNSRVLSLGSRKNYALIASNVFEKLREFDKIGVGIIYAEAFDEKEMGLAVMNRMKKAAGFNIIEV